MTETYIIQKCDLIRLCNSNEIFTELTNHLTKKQKKPEFPDIFKVFIKTLYDENDTTLKYFTMKDENFLNMCYTDTGICTILCLFRSVGKLIKQNK